MITSRISRLAKTVSTLAMVASLGAWQARGTLVVGPILQGASSTNIYVLAECSVGSSSPMTVKYGLTASYGSSASTSFTMSTGNGSTNVHRIKLTGLTPNTLYHYQLTGQGYTSPDLTFTTMTRPGASFRFVWQADFRSTPSVHDQIAGRIVGTDKPLFTIEGGDTCANGSWAGWHNEFFTGNEQSLEHWIPTFSTPGNHEGWGTLPQAYYQSPDSSGANGYYSFDCGDVHVTCANFMYSGGYAVGSAQYNWIQQDVQSSLAAWKIFVTHAPAYTYGGSGSHPGDANFQTISANILQPNGVKVYFAGHNHFYQHNLVNGIHHMTIGSAGAPLYAISSNSTYTIKSVYDNSYMVADVTPTHLHMVAYNNVGTVLETIDLYKPAAPTGLTATAGDSQVSLKWNSVSGATSYTVRYGTTSGGPYPSSRTVTTTNTAISGLANGQTYYFVVSATDSNGPSAISSEASATPTGGPQPPFNPADFSTSMKITFAGYSRGTAVTDFPVLVNLSSSISGFAYSQFQPGGTDLRFTDAGGNVLNHEIDEWNTSGTSRVWVRVPRIGSGTDYIMAYWGNPSLTSPPAWSTNGSSWLNFFATFHLKESGFPYADSSAGNHTVIAGTIPTMTTSGMVGNAETFSGSSQYLAPSGAINLGSAFSLSAWVKLDTTATNIQTIWANKAGGWNANGVALYINSYNTADGEVRVETGDGVNGLTAYTSTGAIPTGSWHHILASVDLTGGTATIYVDGANKTSANTIQKTMANNSIFNIGRLTNGASYFKGTLDEARIETTRSADWAWATWITVTSNSVLSSYGAATPQGFDTNAFSSGMRITFSGYNRAGTVTDFPVLVRLDTSISGFAYSQFASPSGYDLRFTDAASQAVLYHEIDQWNTNGTSLVWVRVPQISSSTNSIMAYWGNPALTTPANWMTNGSVWTNFSAVLHLKESALPYADSSMGNHPATAGTIPAMTAFGLIGNAETFNGSSQYLVPSGAINLGNAFSLSAWVKLDTTATNIQTIWANKAGGWNANGVAMYINSYNTADGEVRVETGDGTNGLTASTTTGAIPTGGWHHILASVDRAGGTATIYVDGVNKTSATAVQKTMGNNATFNIGRLTNSAYYFKGTLDDLRIETTRSADWAWTAWMTAVSNSVLSTYSSVAPHGQGLAPVQALVTATPPPPPPRALSLNAGSRVISWSQNSGGVLYCATNLTPPVCWMRVTNAPISTNGQFQLPLPVNDGVARYYRLQSQ